MKNHRIFLVLLPFFALIFSIGCTGSSLQAEAKAPARTWLRRLWTLHGHAFLAPPVKRRRNGILISLNAVGLIYDPCT